MELLFEVLFELIFEGAADVAGNRRVPMAIRIGAAALVILLATALMGIVMFAAIASASIPFIIIAALILVAVVTAITINIVKKFRVKRRR